MRRWSMFSIIDPVCLFEGNVKQGSSEWACEYAGRVFVFLDEINRNRFMINPKLFLRKAPQLPKNYNIALTGPSKSGKTEFANRLAEAYGYQVIELQDYLMKKVQE